MVQYVKDELGTLAEQFPLAKISALAQQYSHNKNSENALFSNILYSWGAQIFDRNEDDFEKVSKRTKRCCGWDSPFPKGFEGKFLEVTDFLTDFDIKQKINFEWQICKQLLFPFGKHSYELPSLSMFTTESLNNCS